MDERQEQWQKSMDEERVVRCIELVTKAQLSTQFSEKDIEDLKYFLGLSKEFFQ